jgi:OOP family OmpA-OmpF porin
MQAELVQRFTGSGNESHSGNGMKTTIQQSLLAALAVFGASAAQAQYYGGIELARAAERAQFGFNGGERPSELVSLSQLTGSLATNPEKSLGIKLGYRFNPYFSLEGSFADRSTNLNIFRGELSSASFSNAREKSMSVDLVGTLPVREKWLLQGRAGVKTDQLFQTNYVHPVPFAESTGLVGLRPVNAGFIGAGVQVNFSNSLGLRLEVERTRTLFSDRQDFTRDNISFGLLWRF